MVCRLGLVEWVRLRVAQLKSQGQLKKMMDSQDAYGVQPLTWAAMEGHVEVAEVLLPEKANPNIMSALQSRNSWLRVPWAKRARSYKRELTESDGRWMGDHTALYRAAFRGHTEMVKLLLDWGANPDTKE